MILSLVPRGEDALQRDAEVERQKRLHVHLRLAAADISYRSGIYRIHVRHLGGVDLRDGPRQEIAGGKDGSAVVACGLKNMDMRRQLGDRKRVRLLAALFAEQMLPKVNRCSAPEIR